MKSCSYRPIDLDLIYQSSDASFSGRVLRMMAYYLYFPLPYLCHPERERERERERKRGRERGRERDRQKNRQGYS